VVLPQDQLVIFYRFSTLGRRPVQFIDSHFSVKTEEPADEDNADEDNEDRGCNKLPPPLAERGRWRRRSLNTEPRHRHSQHYEKRRKVPLHPPLNVAVGKQLIRDDVCGHVSRHHNPFKNEKGDVRLSPNGGGR
jgi:hypothetical protein